MLIASRFAAREAQRGCAFACCRSPGAGLDKIDFAAVAGGLDLQRL